MDYSDIYLVKANENSVDSDYISNFVEQFTLIPNRFGHQQNDPKVGCGLRIIGDFEIIYVLGGKSYITVDDKDYICREGDLILIPPFVQHKIQSDQKDPHNQYWFHFDLHPFYKYDEFKSGIITGEDYRLNIGIIDELIMLYELLEEELEKKEAGYAIFFKTLLPQIITIILRKTCKKSQVNSLGTKKDSQAKDLIDKSIDYINDNLSRQIYIDDLCAYLHVSQSHLFKTFNKIINFPPAKFIQFIKIKRGEQLIKTSKLSITEISNRLGFNSPFYFSRVFKEYYTVSPNQYRNKMNY